MSTARASSSAAQASGKLSWKRSRDTHRLTLLVVPLLATAAWAQQPCADDVKKFCANVQPGSGRVNGCLEQHHSELSPVCLAKFDADMKKAKVIISEFYDACGEDVGRVCSNVQPGAGRLLKCLVRNDYALSPTCLGTVNKLEAARQKMEGLRRQCEPDVKKLCSRATAHAGELLACLEANRAELSPACRAADPAFASEAASLVDTVDEMTSEARIQDTVAILQGLNTVAFSRNQLSFSFDFFQHVTNKPLNVDSLTFSPLLVFGPNNEFAVQVKVPVAAAFPMEGSAVSGVANVNTAFGWAFYAHGSIRQYAAIALQWNSASVASLGAPWVLSPVYALAVGLAGWVSLTTELSWNKSLGAPSPYPGVNLLVVRPILVFNLPSTTFLSIDAKLGWDFLGAIFVPILRFQAGKLIGRDRDLSLSAWYQVNLNTVSRGETFDFGVGFAFSYFFNW